MRGAWIVGTLLLLLLISWLGEGPYKVFFWIFAFAMSHFRWPITISFWNIGQSPK
jgi:hypothetical protein